MSTDSSNGKSRPQSAEELNLTHRADNVVRFRSRAELQEMDFTDQDLKDLGIAPSPR